MKPAWRCWFLGHRWGALDSSRFPWRHICERCGIRDITPGRWWLG